MVSLMQVLRVLSLAVVVLGCVVVSPAMAVVDSILGVDSADGIPQVMTPEEAAELLGVAGSGWPTQLTTAATTSESTPIKIRGTGGQSGNGWNLYQHSSGTPTIKCVSAEVEGDCHVGVALNSGKSWKVTNSTGSSTYLQVDQSTGKVSALTVSAEDSGVNITLYRRLCGGDLVGVDPASGTAGHILDKDQLSTAPTATVVTGTNQTYGVARFPDSDGDYGVSLHCPLLAGHTGNVDVVAWGKTTGTGNFRLQIASKCYASDEANDASYNTASVFTLAAGTSGRLNRYTGSNITMTGCAANELAFIRVFRNRTEASDTLNSTFDLATVEIWARNTE